MLICGFFDNFEDFELENVDDFFFIDGFSVNFDDEGYFAEIFQFYEKISL